MPYKQTQNFNREIPPEYQQTTQTQGNWKYPQGHNFEGMTPEQVNQGYTRAAPAGEPQRRQEQPKGETIEITAIFKATTPSFNKEGKLMEGMTNGKQWKAYDVIFLKPGAQQNKVFRVFNDLSGKSLRLNQLIPGTEYKLLYEQGIQQVKANKLFFIGLPTQQKPIYSQNNVQTSQATPTQQTSLKQPGNVLPEELDLWNSKEFGSEEEWMRIAYESDRFDSEERAKEVFRILSKQ